MNNGGKVVYRQTMKIPKHEMERWNGLMSQKCVDYGKESLPRFSCVFVKSVKFDDGVLADLKVCTSDTNQDLWSEMVVYDEHGHELWVSEAGDGLDGPWEFELKNIYSPGDGFNKYVVDVVVDEGQEVYDKLGCARGTFCATVRHEIEEGITSEYSAKIAYTIADRVAADVLETADPEEWNSCDVRLGIGRVILKRFGVEV